ncbi:DUF1877 family protein [Chitinophaga sp. YR627]|uniref:DUF1877 family protein n=1 Tax=Chitinophaga sp. YR627 TaxID=1881041 RepID=UPI0015A61076
MRRKFPHALGIYPQIWDQADSFDDLYNNFTALQQIFASAAQNDQAIITFIN